MNMHPFSFIACRMGITPKMGVPGKPVVVE